MQNTAQARLDGMIQTLEAKLEKLRVMRSAIVDSELVEEMKELFAVREEPGVSMTVRDKPLGQNARKVIAFFRKHNNEPADLFVIAQETGISRDSLRQTVYQTHLDLFERDGKVGGRRRSLFWLKEGVTTKNGRGR